MSSGHQYPVGPLLKRREDKIGVHPTGTHQADDAHVGRILKTADTCQVGGRIGTPVAASAIS